VDVHARIRECDLLVGRQQAIRMIGMHMSEDDRVDHARLDASGGKVLRETPQRRPEQV
jgi:hypothetical protein